MVTIVLNGNLKGRVIWDLILPLFLLSIIFVVNKTHNFGIKLLNTHRSKNIFHIILVLISISVIARYTRGALILNNESRMASDKAVASYLSQLPLNFYVSWCDLKKYDPLDLPYSQQNQYFLGWLAGSPFNKEKIKKYTGKEDIGVYTIFNKDIVWIFRNNYFFKKPKYQEKVKEFYLNNYKQTKVSLEILPINDRDTLYKYTFFIPAKENKTMAD